MSLGMMQGGYMLAGSGGGGGGLDAATTAWVSAVTGAGGSVSTNQQTYVNNLITGLKTDGVWTLMDRIWLFAGESSSQQATIDLVANATATVHGSISLNASGYLGDGSTGYLSTTFNPSTAGGQWALNSACIGGYVIASRASADASAILGLDDNASYAYIQPHFSGDIISFDLNAVVFPSLAATDSKGSWLVTRVASNALTLYKNGSSVSTPADTSSSLANQTVFLCAYNNNGSAAGFSDDRVGAAYFGGGLNGTQSANLMSRINTYMTAWTINVY